MILNLVFSKDRPLQLHAHLESFFHNAVGKWQTVVLAHSMTPEYRQIKSEFGNRVRWADQQDSFSCCLHLLINSWQDKLVLFAVDDSVYTGPVCQMVAENALRKHVAGMVELRQGYWLGSPAWLCGNTGDRTRDYPFNVTSAIHWKADVIQILRKYPIEIPNDVEAAGYSYFINKQRRVVACYPTGRVVTQDVNRVQGKFTNTFASNTLTAEHCLELWRQGHRLDWQSMQGVDALYVGATYWKTHQT